MGIRVTVGWLDIAACWGGRVKPSLGRRYDYTIEGHRHTICHHGFSYGDFAARRYGEVELEGERPCNQRGASRDRVGAHLRKGEEKGVRRSASRHRFGVES